MEEISNEIRVGCTDREINSLLENAPGSAAAATCHFDQQESMFLQLAEEFIVPPLPIHHDVRQSQPGPKYLAALREALASIVRLVPEAFRELTYLFDPREVLRPSFFRLYRIEDCHYLYLLQLDLLYRAQEHRLLERGDNDLTPRYASRRLFLEALFIPLEKVHTEGGKVQAFTIRQMISNTWIGEVGRGYFVQGIWMDNELSRFFTRLFLPPGQRIYPFFPYVCKYKTICQNVIGFSPEERRRKLPYLHRAVRFLAPLMGEVEKSLRGGSFSEDNPGFQLIRQKVPAAWLAAWQNLRVRAYLNDQDMKEFQIEDQP